MPGSVWRSWSHRCPPTAVDTHNDETRSGPYLAHLTVTGPFAAQRARRHRESPAHLHVPADRAGGRGALRGADSLDAGAARLSAAAERCGVGTACWTAYRDGRHEAEFDAGIELAVRQLLVEPGFLYRIEESPRDIAPDTDLPRQRSGSGLPPVVFPLEQHSG